MPVTADLSALSEAQGAEERFNSFKATYPVRALSDVLSASTDESDPILSIAGPMLGERLAARTEFDDVCQKFKPFGHSGYRSAGRTHSQGMEQSPCRWCAAGWRYECLRGSVLEKAAVNMSVVCGPSYPSIEKEYSGQPFLAAGVSFICHPYNPNAPIAHMNIRILKVGTGEKSVFGWVVVVTLRPWFAFKRIPTHFIRVLNRPAMRIRGVIMANSRIGAMNISSSLIGANAEEWAEYSSTISMSQVKMTLGYCSTLRKRLHTSTPTFCNVG